MRYRALDSSGDYTFGQGPQQLLVDSPAAVAQAVLTRLRLFRGEYFLDTTQGMDWQGEVLGYGNGAIYDAVIQEHITGTMGVVSLTNYSSTLQNRKLTINGTITTAYGLTTLAATLTL